MKTPLRYQITEFDCGTVSLLNAISYLYDREEVPSELVRAIYVYTLNCHDTLGIMSDEDMIKNLCKWVTDYSNRNEEFDLKCEYLSDSDVTYDNILSCIRKHGVCFVKCYQIEPHYIIITNINEIYTYIFDPYYIDKDNYEDEEVRIIEGKMFEYNRIVKTNRVFSSKKIDFALGEIEQRKAVLMNRVK